jgi:hypothetical protein
MIDIKAFIKLTVDYNQHFIFNLILTTFINMNSKGKVKIKFKIGFILLISFITVTLLIETIEFYIVKTDTLFLLCFININRPKVQFNNLKNLLIIP